MAAVFENFGLTDLVAKPEDALRLATLAAVDGAKIRGYGGNYFQYRMGDALVVVRTAMDYATNESELLGMDTHAVSDSVWECSLVTDVTPADFDPLERRLLVESSTGGMASVELVNADVLPAFYPGTPLRLNMAAFPRWVDYAEDEAGYVALQKTKKDGENLVLAQGGVFACGYVLKNDPQAPPTDLEGNEVLLRGVVKDVKVGETFMGMEPMTTFIRATVETRFGDVEVCHVAEQVAEDQKDLVKVGSILSALCILSGDPAIGDYAGGVCHNEAEDLCLLRNFFENGGADRLRPALHSDCVYHSDYSGQDLRGLEATIALLKDVEGVLDDESRYFAYPARITRVEEDGGEPPRFGQGKDCLLLAQGGPEQYVALCFVVPDSVGRIKEIHLSQDGRYHFERTDRQEDPFAAVEPPKDALEAMLPWAVTAGLIGEAEELTADTASFPAFEAAAKERMAALPADGDLRTLFGDLFAAAAGGDREQGEALYDGFQMYAELAKPDQTAYAQQLLNALVLVQRFGELHRKG